MNLGNINLWSIFVGCVAFYMSFFVSRKRATNPSAMRRLNAMKSMLGDAMGTRFHWIVYVALPFLLGIMFVVNGLRGRPPF
ncbi:MAG: hypothetical protein MO847_06280 [Candidatus Protistobacter heckmanni]|nr:hypothetical protein [Candidatus Protistobacter heckmanni]